MCLHPRGPTEYTTPQASTSSFQNASLGAVLNQNESPGPRHRAPVFHAADELGSDEGETMEEVPFSDSEDDWEVVRIEGRSEKYNPLKLAKKKVGKEIENVVEKVDQVLKRKRRRGEEADSRRKRNEKWERERLTRARARPRLVYLNNLCLRGRNPAQYSAEFRNDQPSKPSSIQIHMAPALVERRKRSPKHRFTKPIAFKHFGYSHWA
ncbi:hypothetical protein FPQ18DRAFT_311079 [Pyronema domesticum]|nr:hypothetical protein FPQ18DRAFT_311079 [Pyronema domesticum]